MPSPFEPLRALDDAALLRTLKALYDPRKRAPDEAALTAALRGRIVDVPVPGGAVRVDLGDWTSLLVVRLEAWEPHLARLARVLVKPGDVVVDAGAHVGTWTLVFAQLVGETGRVIAYEPWPENVVRARSALSMAGFDHRAEIVSAALGEREGTAPLFGYATGTRFSGPDSMLHSLVRAEGYGADAIDVPVTTLDAANLARVDVLKIDVEGFERAVLRGARGLLGRSPGAKLLVELHPEELAALGSSIDDVVNELKSLGFSVFDLRPGPTALHAEPLVDGAKPTTNHVLATRGASAFDVPW